MHDASAGMAQQGFFGLSEPSNHQNGDFQSFLVPGYIIGSSIQPFFSTIHQLER
jgi:hypothetical protein